VKCLLVSDLHYVLKQFDWIANSASDFDVVVIAGDHLDISSNVSARVQVLVILKYLRRLQQQTQLVICSGNHDLDARNEDGEKIAAWIEKIRQLGIPTDGEAFERDGTLFTVCPWWDGPRTRERVGAQFARDALRPADRWVWVYHAPPSDSPTCQAGKRSIGDDALAEWIEQYQPDLVLTGHIHQAPFSSSGSWIDQQGSTFVLNAGRQIGPCPAHIIFDTQARRAAWFSLAGAEVVPLDRPLKLPAEEISEAPDWLR
jgi:Icc-related predicted phosphoesterase